uniref:Uncharacterized protein n=2 Tax=Leptocylindrus danicus TaxID=163516 RepID=A0A7S2KJN4_9STRA
MDTITTSVAHSCLDTTTTSTTNDLPFDDSELFGYGVVIGIAVIGLVLSLLSLFTKYGFLTNKSTTKLCLIPMGLNDKDECVLGCYDVDSEMYQAVCTVAVSSQNLAEIKKLAKVVTAPSNFDLVAPLSCYYAAEMNKTIIEVQMDARDMSMSDRFRGAVGKTGSSDCGIGLHPTSVKPSNSDAVLTTSDDLLSIYYSVSR